MDTWVHELPAVRQGSNGLPRRARAHTHTNTYTHPLPAVRQDRAEAGLPCHVQGVQGAEHRGLL
eukprot:1157675-Pelagomonas_calceolata.AAC.1